MATDDGIFDLGWSPRPEWNSAVQMKDIIREFTSRRQTVVNPCLGTFSTVNSCMLLPTTRRLVEYEIENVCFK